MMYYKIIQNGQVIGAGCTFLKWNAAKRRFFYCGVDDAERVQDTITERLYHAEWLALSPPEAGQADEAAVEIITASEYDEIIALLIDGETIQEPDDPEPEPIQEPVQEPEPERPMTVAEMRSAVAEMDDVLNIILGVVE